MNNSIESLIYSSAVLLITSGLISPLITSCSDDYCDGKKCKIELGFKEKMSARDSIFRIENPEKASKFNVFIENSMSMDGYANGHTDFNTSIYRLTNQVITDVLKDDSNVSLNYINDTILRKNKSIKQFTKNLSPESFHTAGGNITDTDVIEVISKVVKNTEIGQVSMLVSDCVYSPESADDIDKSLKKQQTDMLNILKNKAKFDPSFGVLVYRLKSDFHGFYYTKTNKKIECNGPRPYFVWFFGDESLLANVRECISTIMTEEKADYIIGIPGYKYVPYKTLKSSHAYHYLNAKAGRDSIFKFSFYADLSSLPLTKDYILDKSNYSYGAKKYYISKIDSLNPEDESNKGYNYKYTVCVRGGGNSIITPTTVDISMNSMLKTLPKWVTDFDDPKGNDYNNGYDPNLLRTFGLKSLIEGIADFYKGPYYVTYKIIIN